MKSVLLSVCLFTALFAASASAQSVSKEVLVRDLAYAVKTVSEVHPVDEGFRESLEKSSQLLFMFRTWRVQ